MKTSHLCKLFLLMILAFFQVLLETHLIETAQQKNRFSYDQTLENFREQNISQEMLGKIREESKGDWERFGALLTAYYSADGTILDINELDGEIELAKKYHSDEFLELSSYGIMVWKDLKNFPVGKIKNEKLAGVQFGNTWMQSRTYGGERGHEGTDIMADYNIRGLYPIYSISDGVVENIGWLPQGGYRIGIRGPSGAYFYYAHLAQYAKDFQPGEEILAHEYLGLMGDTGYSEIEGTTGNFPVHLHLGIYLNDSQGQEFSVNSYPMLEYLYQMEQ